MTFTSGISDAIADNAVTDSADAIADVTFADADDTFADVTDALWPTSTSAPSHHRHADRVANDAVAYGNANDAISEGVANNAVAYRVANSTTTVA